MKEFYHSSIKASPYSSRFITINWSDDDRYCLSVYDKETGNIQDFFSNTYGDALVSIVTESGSILVRTKFSHTQDKTEYTTIFDGNFYEVLRQIVSDY